jgi:hypothetical protein
VHVLGGYHSANAARAWAYLTSIAVRPHSFAVKLDLTPVLLYYFSFLILYFHFDRKVLLYHWIRRFPIMPPSLPTRLVLCSMCMLGLVCEMRTWLLLLLCKEMVLAMRKWFQSRSNVPRVSSVNAWLVCGDVRFRSSRVGLGISVMCIPRTRSDSFPRALRMEVSGLTRYGEGMNYRFSCGFKTRHC